MNLVVGEDLQYLNVNVVRYLYSTSFKSKETCEEKVVIILS